MSEREFPALGFDPAPGAPDSVESLTTQLDRAAKAMESAHRTISGIRSGGANGQWEGAAARGFADSVGELPGLLQDSMEALRGASTQLGRWHSRLTDYQSRAATLEAQAAAAKRQIGTAEKSQDQATAAYNHAACDPDLMLVGMHQPDAESLRAANERLEAAQSRVRSADKTLESASARLDQARDELDAIIKRAQEMLDHHQDDARGIAEALRKANQHAPDTGFWEKAGDWFQQQGHAIEEWATKHADLLKTIGDWLSNISAVLGVLALLTLWCPPLSGALALSAAVLSAGALASHGLAKLGGADVSAMDLIGDGIGAVPFVGAAGTTVRGSVKVAVTTVKVEGRTVARIDDVNRLAKLRQSAGAFSQTRIPREGRVFKANGVGNRFQLAWENHLAKNSGSTFSEKRLSYALTHTPGLRHSESFRNAVRADGSVDPMSWWSRGPLAAAAVPGIVTGSHDLITGEK